LSTVLKKVLKQEQPSGIGYSLLQPKADAPKRRRTSTPLTQMKRAALILSLLFVSGIFIFAQTPIALYNTFSGTINYTVIGGSLRTMGNTFDAVATTTADTTTLTIPSGATIVGAYLYWAASGQTVDGSVTLDGNTVNASRTFTESFQNGPAWLYWFGGFSDVTSYVSSQNNSAGHSYIFSGLTIDTTTNYVQSQAALGGWALLVVYNLSTEVRHTINIYDGFQIFYGNSATPQITFTPNNFYVPFSRVDGKMTHITWEGDAENSNTLNGYSEELGFNGQILTDSYNPPNNQFNSVSNTLFPAKDSTFGVDIDTYDVTSLLHSGDTSATSVYSTGADLVILNAEVISVADTSNSDVQITKTHSGGSTILAGSNLTYTLTAQNNGPDTTGIITVRDSLPSGAQFISASYSGWSVDSSARPVYVFTHSGNHPPGWSSPINITVHTTAAYISNPSGLTLKNTATVSSPQIDRRLWNNTSTDSVTLLTPLFLTSSKSFKDISVGGTYPVINDTLQYTIKVTNTGNYAVSPGNGNPISITDTVPSGFTILSVTRPASGNTISGQVITFANITSLGIGASDSVVYKIKIGPSFTGDTPFTNKAHVKAATVDQLLSTTAWPPPIMSITKSFDPGKTKRYDTTTVRIIIQNTSSVTTSTTTTVSDTLYPASGSYTYVGPLTGSAGSGSETTQSGAKGKIIWNFGTLAPGVSDTLTYRIRLTGTSGTIIMDTAWVMNDQRSKASSIANLKITTNATGSITGSASILPSDTLYYTLIDEDLNTSATSVQTFTDSVFNIRTGEWEFVSFTETGVNTGIFTGKRASVYGASSNGNNNGTIACRPNDTLRITYLDAIDSAGNTNQVRTWNTVVRAGNNATLTGTATILPGSTVSYTLTDNDLNRNSSVVETYTLKDTNKVTNEVENILFTETGANTGIFTGTIATAFGTSAGTNNNGSFNVQAGDSLVISYYDTVTSTGAPGGWIRFTTHVLGGATATLSATSSIHPGDSIYVTVTDNDLNKNTSVAESYSVLDSNTVTHEIETITVTETGVNTGIFTGRVSTRYGVVTGSNNDGFFYTQAGDVIRVTYKDTMQANGGPGSTLTANTNVLGGHPGSLTVSPTLIFPGDSVQVTVTDADLNKNTSAIESYTVRDSNITTHEWENITVTETGINTGIFTAWVHTQFGLTAGTNNDGVFNGKTGDSLVVTYVDTITTNGAPGPTLKAGSGFKGGVTGTITATTPIHPGDSVLVTVTDNDLNKNSSLVESYTLRDTNKTTNEWEQITITETGVNTGIFTKWVHTRFDTVAGTNNDGIFNVKANDTLVVTYRDSLQANGGSATLTAKTVVKGGATATISAVPNFIAPNDTSTLTITDADLNKDTTTVQSYALTVTSSTGETELMTFTETGVNTGIFTKKVPTVFGTTPGPNNNGIFTVQPGDSIWVTYHDSLTAIGDTANISTYFKIGHVTFSTSSKSVLDLNGGSAQPPDTMQYTLKIKNSGTVGATYIAVKDTLPTGVTILAGTITGGGAASGQIISWPTFNLAVGDSATYTYKVQIDSTITSNVAAVNKAHVKANGVDQLLTASFTPVNRPTMTMTKSVSSTTGRMRPGDTLVYTINYKNIGTTTATFVSVSDPNPNNTTYVPESVTLNAVHKTDAADADEVTVSSNIIQVNVGTVTPGQAGTITYRVRIN
jgi:uncharacterized repeat protein (TIGR01451 family)